MEHSSSSSVSSLSLKLKPPPSLMTSNLNANSYWRKRKKGRNCLLQASAISYQKFIHFALNETKRHSLLLPSPLQVMGSFFLLFVPFNENFWVLFGYSDLIILGFSVVCNIFSPCILVLFYIGFELFVQISEIFRLELPLLCG